MDPQGVSFSDAYSCERKFDGKSEILRFLTGDVLSIFLDTGFE